MTNSPCERPSTRPSSSSRWRPRVWLAAAAALLMLAAGAAHAQSVADVRATIILRALMFDRKLKARAGDNVTVAVVFLPGDRTSMTAKDEMHAAFAALTGQKLDGLPISVVDHGYTTREALAAAIKGGIDVLFITAGMGRLVADIKQTSQSAKVPTLTSESELVAQGLALGVSIVGGRPKLVVNLPASKAEGMELSAQVLQLAEVIQ